MKDWREGIRSVWRFDNIPVLIALAGGIFGLAAPAFIEITIGRAVTIIMAVLVAIVLSLGLDRISRFANLEKQLEQMALALSRLADPSADTLLEQRRTMRSPLFEFGEGSRDILAMGLTLRNLGEDVGFLERLLQQGTNLRFLIWKFDEAAAKVEAPSIDGRVDVLRNNRNAAIARFKGLVQRKLKEGYPGAIELRELPSLPRMTVLMLDGDTPRGRMQVELLPYALPANERPAFRLTKADRWYETFLEACNKAWRQAEPFNLVD